LNSTISSNQAEIKRIISDSQLENVKIGAVTSYISNRMRKDGIIISDKKSASFVYKIYFLDADTYTFSYDYDIQLKSLLALSSSTKKIDIKTEDLSRWENQYIELLANMRKNINVLENNGKKEVSNDETRFVTYKNSEDNTNYGNAFISTNGKKGIFSTTTIKTLLEDKSNRISRKREEA
jgi:hypothetical protein